MVCEDGAGSSAVVAEVVVGGVGGVNGAGSSAVVAEVVAEGVVPTSFAAVRIVVWWNV